MNPKAIFDLMMKGNFQGNPMAQNAMQMYQRNDVAGLKQMAENLCRERGMTVDDALRQLKLK